jgi:penicillin-binding protein 1C
MRFWKKYKKSIKKASKYSVIGSSLIVAACVVGFVILDAMYPFPMQRLEELKRRRSSTVVLDRDGNLLRAFLGQDDSWTLWLDDVEQCKTMKNAMIAAEDRRFYLHCGVDPVAIVRAVVSNIFTRRRMSGASTLTMQLMRMSLDHHQRSWKHKFIEIFRALQCERVMSKEQILAWYLNFAPFGSNINGIGSASRIYFQKQPDQLTAEEAAMLAGLVQAPSRLLPYRYPGRAEKRRQVILYRMYKNSFISRERMFSAYAEPLRCSRNSIPVKAPHFAAMLAVKYSGLQVVSTLDARLQYHADYILKQALKDAPKGANGAVVVVNNNDGAVRAFVGSSGLNNAAGQINYAVIPRGPGSLLKPFIYLDAFERGMASPATMFDDKASSFSGYAPRNYDRKWHGKVSVREALAFSYNLPAIAMLQKLGVNSFALGLNRFGLHGLMRPDHQYGLTLALGGAEFSLLELVRAYSAIARLGEMRPLRFVEDGQIAEPKRIADKDAVFLICDILKDRSRLNGRALWNNNGQPLPFAWKTGTSNNLKDAWTIAWTPDWTVGVMLTCAGSGQGGLVGIKHAAPVAATLIYVAAGNERSWYQRPGNVKSRMVCSQSGLYPARSCLNKTRDLFQNGYDHTRLCQCAKKKKILEKLRIVSPEKGTLYSNEIILRAECAKNQKIFWFADGKFIGNTTAGNTMKYHLAAGAHTITCLDNSIRQSQSVSIRIISPEVNLLIL